MSKSMRVWLGELADRESTTIRIYKRWLDRFLEYAEMTPDQFFEFHRDNLRSDDTRDAGGAGRLLKAYLKSIEDKYKPATRTHVVKAVQGFLVAQGLRRIEMNGKKKRIFYDGAHNYKADEYRRVIGRTTLRNRAIILVIKDSGLRVSDIEKLNVGDLQTEEDFIIIDISVEKTGFPAKPCLGPDALGAVREYLATRDNPQDGDPLFIQVQHENRGKRLNAFALASCVKKVCKSAGFDKMSANSFRKWNTTNLQSWINPIWLMMLQGRAMPTESVAHYSLPTDEQLLGAYKENYDRLQFYERKVSKSEVTKLREQLEESQDLTRSQGDTMLRLIDQFEELRKHNLELLARLENKE